MSNKTIKPTSAQRLSNYKNCYAVLVGEGTLKDFTDSYKVWTVYFAIKK
jgi:hypothetical protein